MTLTDFYEQTTKKFDVTITYNGSNPDISSDTVKIIFKSDANGSTVLEKSADVTSQGTNGIAQFELTPSDTAITPAKYLYKIIWELATGEKYVLEQGEVNVLDQI